MMEVEKRKVHLLSMATNQEVIKTENFSSWRRLIRVAAYVLRFVHKLRKALTDEERDDISHSPTPEELRESERMLITGAQTSLRAHLEKGEFKMLSPYTDAEGIIRVGGRTDKALISFDMRHPVLLPRDNYISCLITCEMHQDGHGRVETIVPVNATADIVTRVRAGPMSEATNVLFEPNYDDALPEGLEI